MRPCSSITYDWSATNRAEKVLFEGLYAFDLGTGTSPVMEGFTQITPATMYSKGRGYGLMDAKIWRTFDALQPDPLYQDFICIESGGLAVDVPNGRYRVFVNMDNPSGYWGEYQIYRRRAILAQGREVASDGMDFESFKKKYFRFWNVEDLPTDNTFDKYQRTYQTKTIDVDVKDGQLRVGFQGDNWACSVSAIVIYPVTKAAEGERFLNWVEGKRRFYFDNNFKRILHRGSGDPVQPTAEDTKRGYLAFQRDSMQEVFYNDTPSRGEIGKPLAAEAFAGQIGTMTLALLPQRDLGKVSVTASDLVGPSGTIPSTAIDIGYVSYRITPSHDGRVRVYHRAAPDHAEQFGRNAQRHHAAVLAHHPHASERTTRRVPRHGNRHARARRRGIRSRCVYRAQGHTGSGGHPRRAVWLFYRHALVRR